MTLMMMMLFITSLIFIIEHPLSLGMILLLQTFFIAMLTGLMNYNFFYSYMLFLIMVGGMLILFIYMTSIASNEKFNFKKWKIFYLSLIFILPELWDPMYWNFLLKPPFYIETSHSLQKFFTSPNFMILIMLMIYLLLTLIASVKISNIKQGSLRQKF